MTEREPLFAAGREPSGIRTVPWNDDPALRPRALWEVLTDEPPEAEAPEDNHPSQLAYDEGIRRARATVSAIMDRYHGAIAELELLRDRVLLESEEDLVELALQIAREVLGGEVEARREFTARMVAFALKTLRAADSITLRIGPTDLEALRKKHPELVSEQSVVRVVEDVNLSLGGVVAECDIGRVDASIEGRLREAGRQLRGGASPADDEEAP